MSRYLKYTIEQKIRACEDYLSGALSVSEICVRLGMSPKNGMTIYKWLDIKYGAQMPLFPHQRTNLTQENLNYERLKNIFPDRHLSVKLLPNTISVQCLC